MNIDHHIKDNVRQLLLTNPKTRDNDKLLEWEYIVKYELPKRGLLDEKFATAFDIKQIFLSKDFHFESIRRYRQKLQEQEPETRGHKYRLRHQHKEKVKAAMK